MYHDAPMPVASVHGRIFREPKGGPDVTFAGREAQLETLVRAANILSVQGWTARIVLLTVNELHELPADERALLLGSGPLVCSLSEPMPDAAALAAAARKEICKP